VNFYKTSLYSGLYSVINLITGLVITKLTASLIGPVGTAYIGKFGNISGLILVFSTASIATGIIKYVSEYKDNKPELIKVINSAFGIILTGSVIASLFVFASYKILNASAFEHHDFELVFILFGVFIFIISSQVLFTGILNGLGEIKLLSYINIAAALLNLLFTSYFIYEYRIAGALFSNSLYGIFVTLSGLFALHKLNILRKEYFRPKIDLAIARNLIKYGLFAAITSFSWMGSMLVIREMVENHLSTVDAGLWQAMFSLSDRYLAVITSMLIVYFIPTLSSINETPELVREIRKGFKRIIPLMIFISGGIWLCKDLIISILLAESFRPMRDLFTFQMMGDVFRISAAILGYLIASKAMFRSGLKADLSFHAILILSSYFFLIHYGLIGMSYAYALSTLLYLMIYLFIFKDLMVLIKKSVLPKPWLK
jgi:O-antigen/teichoic acid export membrane protein